MALRTGLSIEQAAEVLHGNIGSAGDALAPFDCTAIMQAATAGEDAPPGTTDEVWAEARALLSRVAVLDR